jgi:hypothetical protein
MDVCAKAGFGIAEIHLSGRYCREPAFTVAVRVITLPAATVVTAVPPDVTVTVVVVPVCAAAPVERIAPKNANTIANLRTILLSFDTELTDSRPQLNETGWD